MEQEKLMADKAHLRRVEVELLEKGLLMKAGFVGFRVACDLHDAPKHQIESMEEAFMAGCQHTFSSLMAVMTEDREPTVEDLRRMELIHEELQSWLDNYCRKHNIPLPEGRTRQ
jgi:hypothetical protein